MYIYICTYTRELHIILFESRPDINSAFKGFPMIKGQADYINTRILQSASKAQDNGDLRRILMFACFEEGKY